MTRDKVGWVHKKKHANKPRPDPVPPLTEIERQAKAGMEFRKGEECLAEAELLADWGKAPNACAVSAYYAMHHFARAALFAAGGVGKRKDVPASHEHVIQHYGKLVEGRADFIGQSGRILNYARSERVIADYDLYLRISSDEAAKTTKDARQFRDACVDEWKLSAPRYLYGEQSEL